MMDPESWAEICPACDGEQEECELCGGVGLVEHSHQPTNPAALVAHDDQIKATLNREAQIVSYFRDSLIKQGFSDGAAERMTETWYLEWAAG